MTAYHGGYFQQNDCYYRAIFGEMPIKEHFLKTSDKLPHETYQEKLFKLDLAFIEIGSIKLHIQHAYLKKYQYLATFHEVLDVSPIEFGYKKDDDAYLYYLVTAGKTIPDDFPVSCN